MKTGFVRKEDVTRSTHLIDAKGKVVGRLATTIAGLLTGKGKENFTPHVDQGDTVIVINAAQVRISGKKAEYKKYKQFSGYPGGLKEYSFERVLEYDAGRIITNAVRGMVPKSILGRRMMKRLRVFKDEKHTHGAQKPVPFTWTS